MERKLETLEARNPRPSQPREVKRKSYSQAAAAKPSKTLFRRVQYSIGVVVATHHHKSGTYARIFRRKGEHLSIKVTDDSTYHPGDLIRVTDTLVDGDTGHCIYGTHSQPVDESSHPLCEGTVKSFDKAKKLWNVKVRSVSRYLKVIPGSFTLLREQTIFFIPSFRHGSLEVKKIVDVEGGISADNPPSWTISEDLMQRLAEHLRDISLVIPPPAQTATRCLCSTSPKPWRTSRRAVVLSTKPPTSTWRS